MQVQKRLNTQGLKMQCVCDLIDIFILNGGVYGARLATN